MTNPCFAMRGRGSLIMRQLREGEIERITRATCFSAPSHPVAMRPDYDPLRPDFIEVAGGFPALTGGAGGGAGGWSFVGSGTE